MYSRRNCSAKTPLMMKGILSILLLGTALAQAEPVPTALKVGDSIPDVTLRTVDNQEVKLRTLVAEKPTVLVFFRGGWCPFCNAHLSSLLGIEQELNKEGVQLIAIGMDQPSKLRETMQHDKLDYTLLSDSDATAVKAFGIAYKVDDATLARMKGFNVDLDAATGNSDLILLYLWSTPRASSVSCMRTQILKYALRQQESLKQPN